MVNALARVGSVLRKAAVGFPAHVVKGVEQEAAGAAGRIKDKVGTLRGQNFHGKGNQFAGREVLAEVALKEASHELLEGDALGVQLRAVQGDAFQMLHALGQDGGFNVDAFGEYVRLPLFFVLIEFADPSSQNVRSFPVATLEMVGFAVLAVEVFLVAVFDKDDF